MTFRELSFLALGDSYTIGEGVAPSDRWPVQLVRAIRSEGILVGDPVILARTGWTTGELLEAMAADPPQGPYDLVSVLVGVNDQYRARPMKEFQADFRRLLDLAVGFTGGDPFRVLALSIPDWGVTPFARGRNGTEIGRDIDAFNALERKACRDVSVTFLDITGISREGGDDAKPLAADGLHPSGAMYARWLDAILPPALEVLERRAGGIV